MNFYEKAYGKRETNAVVDIAGKMIGRMLKPSRQSLEILDIGCGSMNISNQIVHAVKSRIFGVKQISLTGWDISEAAVKAAKEKGFNAEVQDITKPLEKQGARFDVICFFEVLEHIADTDQAMKNIRALLKDDGVVVLSTPNLASWYNRIFLLLGLQPHCTELSFERARLGNWVTKKLIPEAAGSVAGHLRVFTWCGLKDFLNYHGFSVLAARGVSNHKFDVFSKVIALGYPGLAGDICLIAKKL